MSMEEIKGNLSNAVLTATESVFKSMFGESIISGKPTERKIGAQQYEINVIISFVGDVVGSFTLKLNRTFMEELTIKLLGEVENDEMMFDAAGEFLNMIVGAAKTKFSDDQNVLKMSLPTVIIGKSYIVHTTASKSSKVNVINFIHGSDTFCMEIFLLD